MRSSTSCGLDAGGSVASSFKRKYGQQVETTKKNEHDYDMQLWDVEVNYVGSIWNIGSRLLHLGSCGI